MALSQTNKAVTKYPGEWRIAPVGAAQTLYYGAMMIQEDGYMKKVTGAAQGHFKVAGVARGEIPKGQNAVVDDDCDNSAGAAGALNVKVEPGVLALKNDGTIPLVAADAGLPCYAVDDEAVSKDSAEGNRPVAGIFLGIDPNTSRCIVAVGLDESQAPRIWSAKANADLRLLQYTAVKLINDANKTEIATVAVGTDVAVFGILLNAPNIDEIARVCVFGPCPGKAVAAGYTAAQALMAGAGGALELATAAKYFIAIALETAAAGATEMVFVQRGTTVA